MDPLVLGPLFYGFIGFVLCPCFCTLFGYNGFMLALWFLCNIVLSPLVLGPLVLGRVVLGSIVLGPLFWAILFLF
jgi:hypothetical protein